MTLDELWQLFPIVLVPNNPCWKEWADDEIDQLKRLLSDCSPVIHHIGSTAIPDIKAKPIVDILVEITHNENLSRLRNTMENAGYICMSSSSSRLSFNKGYTSAGYAERVFHIHIHLKGDNDEIIFRDYLRENPDVAHEYELLKMSLLPQYSHDRDKYTEAKTEFVRRVTALAKDASNENFAIIEISQKFCNRLLICLVAIFFLCVPLNAVNIVTYSVSDSIPTSSSEELRMLFKWLSNADNRVRMSFELQSTNAPFTIYKAEWQHCDSMYEPMEPFSLIAQTNESTGKNTKWHITLDFPFSSIFDEYDTLILYTDRGIIRCPTSREGQLRETIEILTNDYEMQIDTSKKSSRMAWNILVMVLTGVIAVGGAVFVIVHRRFVQKHREIEELSLLIAERTDRNLELEAKVDALYGSRLDTLNMLCNEYFEKSESDKLKLTLYNEVEKHILALRDTKSIAELEGIVNTFLDNILIRIREQLPELNKNDRIFLTYLYAGFSPRAVCIFTNIKIKNFYNRRSRLKDRILASDALDKEYFVSKM